MPFGAPMGQGSAMRMRIELPFAAFIRAGVPKWAKVIKAANVKFEE